MRKKKRKQKAKALASQGFSKTNTPECRSSVKVSLSVSLSVLRRISREEQNGNSKAAFLSLFKKGGENFRNPCRFSWFPRFPVRGTVLEGAGKGVALNGGGAEQVQAQRWREETKNSGRRAGGGSGTRLGHCPARWTSGGGGLSELLRMEFSVWRGMCVPLSPVDPLLVGQRRPCPGPRRRL